MNFKWSSLSEGRLPLRNWGRRQSQCCLGSKLMKTTSKVVRRLTVRALCSNSRLVKFYWNKSFRTTQIHKNLKTLTKASWLYLLNLCYFLIPPQVRTKLRITTSCKEGPPRRKLKPWGAREVVKNPKIPKKHFFCLLPIHHQYNKMFQKRSKFVQTLVRKMRRKNSMSAL
jgi:hypothetical protein